MGQLKEQTTKSPNINFKVISLILQKLRSHIIRRTNHSFRTTPLLIQRSRKLKRTKFNISRRSQKDILWFYIPKLSFLIPMNDFIIMEVLQSQCSLQEPTGKYAFREISFLLSNLSSDMEGQVTLLTVLLDYEK